MVLKASLDLFNGSEKECPQKQEVRQRQPGSCVGEHVCAFQSTQRKATAVASSQFAWRDGNCAGLGCLLQYGNRSSMCSWQFVEVRHEVPEHGCDYFH
jgi:hypothetical protein